MNIDAEIMDALSEYYDDPLGYVLFAFPWDTDPSIQIVELEEPWASRYQSKWGPDKWACEFLDDLGAEIRERGFNGRTSVDPIRFSTASGHGIGKSCLVAWIIKFVLDTRPFSRGVVTANTSDQLKTKTWAEVGKWHKISITSHMYLYTSGRGAMSLRHKEDPGIWRCDAQTCREENSEAFQGLHAVNSTPFYIFDEASGIPNAIWEARAGGATDGEPMSFDFGNPTRKSGMFFENTIGKYRHRYKTRSIDSRSVQITNKRLFAEWATDHGEDSDFFKVKVRGVFPSAGSVQFISTDAVIDAVQRELVSDDSAPLVIGVDVARFGDDSTVIYPRIGYDARTWGFRRYHGLDTVQVVGKVIEAIKDFQDLGKQCSGLFVDGGGLGAGVVDQLRHLGYSPIDVNFGERAVDESYRLRGDEMWGHLKDALPKLMLPDDQGLIDALTQREYFFTATGKIALEPKKDMKDRLGAESSPDEADALGLTFAQEPALALGLENHQGRIMWSKFEYDPLA